MQVKIFTFVLFISLFCAACGALTSVTTIAPNESFVLGNNNHLPFTARVKNIDSSPVEILQTLSGKTTSLGVLQPNESGFYKAAMNSMVSFKNLGKSPANIKVKVVGDTNLSMEYSK
jgi:hypothetical protein